MIRDDIRDKCQNRWPSILQQMGFPTGSLNGHHGPCPMCGGKDRFRFSDRDGTGSAYCNQCGKWSGGVWLIMAWKSVSFRGACLLIEEVVGKSALTKEVRPRVDADQVANAMKWLWTNAAPLTGEDPPSRYLQSRGIDILPPGTAVRYCAEMPDYVPELKRKLYRPAMLSRLVNQERGALHITFLTATGEKADLPKVKRFFTGARVPPGGTVRLAPAAEVMGVSTGLETSMSAMIKFAMPVWATMTDVGLLKFQPPPECKCLTIYSDNDEGFSGQHASTSLAYILTNPPRPGLRVLYKMPPDGFKDWNDVLTEEKQPKNVIRIVRNVEDDEGEGHRAAPDWDDGSTEHEDAAS